MGDPTEKHENTLMLFGELNDLPYYISGEEEKTLWGGEREDIFYRFDPGEI